jgi:hypothetical protein
VVEGKDGYCLLGLQKAYQIYETLHAFDRLIVDGKDYIPHFETGLSKGTFLIHPCDHDTLFWAKIIFIDLQGIRSPHLCSIGLIMVFSSISMQLWGGKPEKIPLRQDLALQEGMTLAEFANANQLPNTVLKEAFGLVSREDLKKRVSELQLSKDQILNRVNKVNALESEHASQI